MTAALKIAEHTADDPAAVEDGRLKPVRRLWSVDQLAWVLGVSPGQVRKQDKAGKIGPRPIRLFDSTLRWYADEILRWLRTPKHDRRLLSREEWDLMNE